MKRILFLFGLLLTVNAYAQQPKSQFVVNKPTFTQFGDSSKLATPPSATLNLKPSTVLAQKKESVPPLLEAPKPQYVRTLTMSVPVTQEGKINEAAFRKAVENLYTQLEANKPTFRIIQGQTLINVGNIDLALGARITTIPYVP